MSVQQPNNLLAKTAGIFENFFSCCAGAHTVQDDATAYTFPELPASIIDAAEEAYYLREDRQDTAAAAEEDEDDDDDDNFYNLKASCSASTSDKAIACTDSFVSKKSSTANGGGGSIVFLDAMEPRVRPVLHFPASASIKTATTASMSSTHSFYTIPTIQGSRTFDSECSLASSTATTQVRSTSSLAQRSISSATTAKIKTPGRKQQHYRNHDGIGRQHDDDTDGQHSMRSVQTQGLSHLPVLSATDGYRC